MLDSRFLLASLFWGSVGFGFALFGWRQKDPLPLFGGVVLIALSYFVSSAFFMSLTSVVLIAGIIWWKRRF